MCEILTSKFEPKNIEILNKKRIINEFSIWPLLGEYCTLIVNK